MSAAKLHAPIESSKAPAIINVRFGVEFVAGHVPGAIHLPFWLAFARAHSIDAPGTNRSWCTVRMARALQWGSPP